MQERVPTVMSKCVLVNANIMSAPMVHRAPKSDGMSRPPRPLTRKHASAACTSVRHLSEIP